MKRLLAYLKPHKWVMTAATVLVLFIIVVELYRPIVIIKKCRCRHTFILCKPKYNTSHKGRLKRFAAL